MNPETSVKERVTEPSLSISVERTGMAAREHRGQIAGWLW